MNRLCFVLASLIPATALADDVVITTPTVTATPGYEETDVINLPMFTSSAILFAGTYGASVIVEQNDDSNGNNRLTVPLVGPWLALHDRSNCDVTLSRCDRDTTDKILLITDGIFQAVGVLGMIDSFLMPTHHRRYGGGVAEVHITPTATNGPGLAVLGRF